MENPYDVHTWSKLYRQERLAEAQARHLEGWLRADRPVRSGRSRAGLAWGGVLSMLRAILPSERRKRAREEVLENDG